MKTQYRVIDTTDKKHLGLLFDYFPEKNSFIQLNKISVYITDISSLGAGYFLLFSNNYCLLLKEEK